MFHTICAVLCLIKISAVINKVLQVTANIMFIFPLLDHNHIVMVLGNSCSNSDDLANSIWHPATQKWTTAGAPNLRHYKTFMVRLWIWAAPQVWELCSHIKFLHWHHFACFQICWPKACIMTGVLSQLQEKSHTFAQELNLQHISVIICLM